MTYLTGDPNPAISPAAVQFDAQVQPFTLEGSLQTAQSTNKEVQLAQDRVRAAQTGVLANDRSGRPNLSFNGSAGYKNGYLPEIGAEV